MAEQTIKAMDVLGLIDREIEVLRGSCENDPDPDNLIAEAMNDWRDARAAFAELVAADVEYDAATRALEEYYRDIAESGYVAARQFDGRGRSERFIRAEIRRKDALAAVRGGAK